MNRGSGESVLLLTFSAAALLSLVSCGSENLTLINDGCICPGGMLQLNCTAVGTGITTWTGTAFSQVGCSGAISLPHSQFQDLITGNESRFCPDLAPAINIMPLSIVDECYTSQLTIPKAGADLNGNTIVCQHDIVGTTEIGSYTIEYTTEPFSPPSNISLTAIAANELTFSWENVRPNCLSLYYEIDSSGCGNCPTTTNSTSVTCSGVRLRGSVEMCSISIRAVTCGNITGDYSQPLTTELQAANTPSVTVVPRYRLNSGLISFTTVIEELEPVSISGNDVIVQSIQVNYTTSDSCSSSFTQSCDQGVCSREINIMTSSCSISADSAVTVSVAATSDLGMGPTTTLSIDGSSRNFVEVSSNIENTTRLTVTCEFTNPLDNNNKSCDVTYGLCGQQLSTTAEGVFSPGNPNIARVVVDFSSPADMYCFNVMASNDTFRVTLDGSMPPPATTIGATTIEATTGVEGTPSEPGSAGLGAGAIAGIVIFLIILIVLGVVAAIIVVIFVLKYYKDREPSKKSPRHVHFQGDPDESVRVEIIGESKDVEAGQTPTRERKQMEEDRLPPTPVAPATSPLGDIFEKHPGQVPVAISRYRGEETLEALDKQYWVPEAWTMRKLEKRIKKKDLCLESEQPLYLTVDNKTVVEGGLTLKEVYNTSHHKGDKHLHVAYSSKDITDPDTS